MNDIEASILTKYEPMLNKIVNNFITRTSMRTVPKEDLMQEARIKTHQAA